MSDLQAIAVILMMVGALLLWALPGPCKCEKCGFHENERRMTALRQKEVQHDFAHKGWGYKDGEPDRYSCPDPKCPRNPAKIDTR